MAPILSRCLSRARQYSRCLHSSASSIQHQTNAFIPTSLPKQRTNTTQNATAPTPLAGMRIAIKDNICTTDYDTTCASNSLRGFQSPYDATLVRLLRGAGAAIAGKTNMDEFGMGSNSTSSAFGPVKMVAADGREYSPGGSSGGSAVAVAMGGCDASIGTDTGGSVRLPAAYCGVYGFKPSYGLVSRRGVVAYANSLDTVGILGAKPSVVRNVFNSISVYDTHDPTSISQELRSSISNTSPSLNTLQRPLRIGIPVDYNIQDLHPEVLQTWTSTLQKLRDIGAEVSIIKLPHTQSALSAYYVLAPAEASSNLARYDGVRFGNKPAGPDASHGTLYAGTRGSHLGDEVRRRILAGTYSLSSEAMENYFVQAQRVRRLVQRDFDEAFAARNPLHSHMLARDVNAAVDVIVAPTAPHPPPLLVDAVAAQPIRSYMADVFTVPASLAGLPAISVPTSKSAGEVGRNFGMQIIGQYGSDALVLQVAQVFERLGLATDEGDADSAQRIASVVKGAGQMEGRARLDELLWSS